MLCIELHRNGTRLATAGLPGKGVLTLIFDRVLSDSHGPEESRHFRLGGLDTSTEPNTSVTWLSQPVTVGDEFVVRFLEQESADRPRHRSPSISPSKAELRRTRLRQLRAMERDVLRIRKHLGLPPKK